MVGESAHRIDADVGYIVGTPTDDALRALQAHRPQRLELVGERHDLGVFAPVGQAVRVLKLSGSIETGRLDAVEGLAVFPNLEVLEIGAKVKRGVDTTALIALQRADLHWQPGADAALDRASLRHLTLRGFNGADLTKLPGSPTLESLWLANPALETLEGLDAFARLSRVRITRARKLQSLHGVQRTALQALEVDDSRALSDLSAIQGLPLQRLALLSIASTASLDVACTLPALRELVIGGANAPDIDWLSVLALPSVRKVSAWWDPVVQPEAALRNAIAVGRAVTRFDPLPGKGCIPLIVEIE